MHHAHNLCSRITFEKDFNVLTGAFETFDWAPGICYGKGSSGGGGTNTVTQSSQPPQQVLDAYTTALNAAQTASSAPLQQYSGPTVAGFTPDQLSAFGTINNAQSTATPFINQAQTAINNGTQNLWSNVAPVNASTISQYESPYTQQVYNAQVAGEQNQDAQQQQALKGNAISSGAWGGDRAGVASGILSGQQDLANNQTNTNILQQGYNSALSEANTEQQAQLGANEANSYLDEQAGFGLAGLGSEAQSTQLAGASAQLQSGALQQQLGQEELNVPYENFLQAQAYPFQTSSFFTNAAEGTGALEGGTSSTTSPAASQTSQLVGLGLGGLGLLGSAFLARGGRTYRKGGSVRGYDSGGPINPLDISIVPSTEALKNAIGGGPPKAPPAYQAPQGAGGLGDTGLNMSGFQSAGKGLSGLLGMFGSSDSGGMGGSNALDPGSSSALDMGGESNALDVFSQGAADWKRGGAVGYADGGRTGGEGIEHRALGSVMGDDNSDGGFRRGGLARRHFDDGGNVGGQSPTTASMSGQQMPTRQGTYNNMTPQQLQNYLMRLPVGSQQAQQIQQVINQKRTMPNTGQAAQGGFGTQQQPAAAQGGFGTQQQPAAAQTPQPMMKRGGDVQHFDYGGNVQDPDSIYIDAPPPDRQSMLPDPDDAQNISPLPMAKPVAPMSPVPQTRAPLTPAAVRAAEAALPVPPPPGGFGGVDDDATLDNGANSMPPSDTPELTDNTDNTDNQDKGPQTIDDDTVSKLTGRTRAKADPWLALAQAGFSMAAGNSPRALENIGKGAAAGIENYEGQRKEADSVNSSVDKLLQEAKQHKDTLSFDQQKENDLKDYRQGTLEQAKWAPSRDPNTGAIALINTKTGEIKQGPAGASVASLDPELAGLTGDAYMSKLKEKDPAFAAQVKAMDDGDLNFPTGFSAKAPYWQQRLNALYQYHPEASQQTSAAYKQFMSGKEGNTTRSLNVATAHINTARSMIDALQSGDTQRINQANNMWKNEFGTSDAPNNLDAVRQIMAGEIVKATTGSAGALGDREEIQERFNSAKSPKLLNGVLDTYEDLMGGQFSGLKQQYQSQTGRSDYNKYLSPSTLSALAKANGQDIPITAINLLRKNPDKAADFEAKYSVDPKDYLYGVK